MDHVCLCLPVRAGRTSDARNFLNQVKCARRAETEAAMRRQGISKDLWYLASSRVGDDQFVIYIEAADFGLAMNTVVSSRDPYDLWLKGQVQQLTGIDFNNPPTDVKPLELLFKYDAAAADLA